MNILIIKDDKPGHYNQTEGLLLSLKSNNKNLNVEYINIEIKSKLTRKLLKIFLNYFPNLFNKNSLKYLKYFYKKFSIPNSKPDLIISTGGNTSNINAWFSKVYKSDNILNGALRGLKEELFTHVTTVIDLGYKNQIILDVAPSIITNKELEKKSIEFLKNKKLDSNTIYYCLLIGGNGSGYTYDDMFYNNLIDFVKKISQRDGIKWLITTSRRTPLQIEKKLKKELSSLCNYFVTYNQKEEKILLPFLGLSKKIFVTEESSSMISEAITALKPVYTIGVSNAKPNKNYLKILNKFELNKQIYRIKDFNLNLNNFKFINKTLNEEFKKIKVKVREYK